MGRRVEHHLGLVLLENLVHTEVVTNTCNQGYQVQAVTVLHHQFLLYFIGIVLVNIHDNHLLRIVFGNLAHQFATDTTAAARDQTDLTFNELTNFGIVEAYRFTAQQVLHLDIANLAYKTCRTGSYRRGIQEASDKGQNLYREASLAADIQNCLTIRRRAARNGKNN